MICNNSEKDSIIIVTIVRTPYFAWREVFNQGLRAGNVTEIFVPEDVGFHSQNPREVDVDKFVSLLRAPHLDNDEFSWTEELSNSSVAL